jgi:hypothetical protein
VKFGNSPPYIKAPTPDHTRQLALLDGRVRQAERRVEELAGEVTAAQKRWEQATDPGTLPAWAPGRGLVAHVALDEVGTLKVVDGPPAFAAGKVGKAADLDGTRFVDAGDAGDFGFDDRFTLAAWVNPRKPTGAILSRTAEEPQADGYGVHLVNGKVQAHFTKRWLDDALRIETLQALDLNRWHHVAVSYDGTRLAAGVKVYIDGTEAKVRVLLDELNQTFQTAQPLRVGSGGGTGSRFDGLIDDVRVYDRVLDPAEARVLAVAASPAEIVRTPVARRSEPERDKLRACFLETAAPKSIRDAVAERRTLREERRRFWESIPTVMVMEEMPTPRDSHVLIRGEYDKRGEKVTPGFPAALQSPGTVAPGLTRLNRLDFARWLVSPANPLTARVAVNQAWQHHFGTGLVKTVEDFGTQGAFPSHPDLLDWLAVEFQSDWDVKRLHQLIVTSATYRQVSKVTPELRTKDPENRLLARFPRLRLSPEVVRDQALFAGGLLVEKVGGPSVKPYQPAGLWKELSGADDYTPDAGEGLYRRSLYTYWKRTAPPPVMATFDAAGRETCWVRESRTNTPLQALTLLNETGFVEAARVLARRVMVEAPTPDARLTRAFRCVVSRPPTAAELRILRDGLEEHLARFRADPAAAEKLLATGAAKPDPKLDPAELAAYATVCNLILNLDEAVTKE